MRLKWPPSRIAQNHTPFPRLVLVRKDAEALFAALRGIPGPDYGTTTTSPGRRRMFCEMSFPLITSP